MQIDFYPRVFVLQMQAAIPMGAGVVCVLEPYAKM